MKIDGYRNVLLADIPCGCYDHAAGARMEKTAEGHFLCSLSSERVLLWESKGIIERQFTDGAWHWRARQDRRPDGGSALDIDRAEEELRAVEDLIDRGALPGSEAAALREAQEAVARAHEEFAQGTLALLGPCETFNRVAEDAFAAWGRVSDPNKHRIGVHCALLRRDWGLNAQAVASAA